MNKFVTSKEAMEILKCSKATLYRLRKDGKVQFNKTGKRTIYYHLSSLNKYMKG